MIRISESKAKKPRVVKAKTKKIVEPKVEGEFLDKEQAKQTLCNHLRKLLEFFENADASIVSDPGAFGYVSQTFKLLIEPNPVHRPRQESKADWQKLPYIVFGEFQDSGFWTELDDAIGFDHKHQDEHWKKEHEVFDRLITRQQEDSKRFWKQREEEKAKAKLMESKAAIAGGVQ